MDRPGDQTHAPGTATRRQGAHRPGRKRPDKARQKPQQDKRDRAKGERPARRKSVIAARVFAVNHETLVAIAAFHPAAILGDHQPDAGVPQRVRAAVA